MATIRDIAKKAGVSVATVSYVINGGPRPVAAATRERVLQAMAELNYHPNTSARQLARQRTEAIGVAIAGLGEDNFSSAYFLEYIRGISYAAEMNGYNVLLLTNQRKTDGLVFYRAIARSRLVDGLLFLGSSIPDPAVITLAQEGFPVVMLARHIPGHAVYSVEQDYYQGAYTATRHLLERGYRRIGFLGQALCFNYGVERLQAYRQALSEAHVPYEPRWVSIPETPRDNPTPEEVAGLLAAGAEALLTDRETVVWSHVRALGKRVPDDVALVGLDESELAAVLEVPLTTVRPPKFDVGKQAVELLLRLIIGDPPATHQIRLPMELIVRQSSPPRHRLGREDLV